MRGGLDLKKQIEIDNSIKPNFPYTEIGNFNLPTIRPASTSRQAMTN